jgi:hypothetical protein
MWTKPAQSVRPRADEDDAVHRSDSERGELELWTPTRSRDHGASEASGPHLLWGRAKMQHRHGKQMVCRHPEADPVRSFFFSCDRFRFIHIHLLFVGLLLPTTFLRRRRLRPLLAP